MMTIKEIRKLGLEVTAQAEESRLTCILACEYLSKKYGDKVRLEDIKNYIEDYKDTVSIL